MIKKYNFIPAVIILGLAFFTMGCAGPGSTLHHYSQNGTPAQVESILNQGANIETKGYWGTPLGFAATFNNTEVVKLLIDRGADLNGGNETGAISKTPLHGAASNGHIGSAQILLSRGANPNIRNRDNQTFIELASSKGHYQFVTFAQGFGTSNKAWERCKRRKTLDCYTEFVDQYPDSPYYSNAMDLIDEKEQEKERLRAKRIKRTAKLRKRERCKMDESSWIYQGRNCQSDLAHGTGKSIHEDGELTFEGQIQNGIRLKGTIYYLRNPLFDGNFVDGKPDGVGVCFHNDEPEECKYYKGKRIDTLYKQRIELAAQMEYMEMLKEEMEQIKSMQASSGGGGQSPAMSDQVKDSLKKKAAEKVAGAIFDHLF